MSDRVALAVEGGLLAAELVEQIAATLEAVKGQKPADFGLSGERLSDEIQAAFSEVRKFWDAFQSRKARSKESPVSITRETLAIPVLEVLGFQPKYQRASLLAGDKRYEISHQEEGCEFPFPIHIVAAEQDLDRRPDSGGRSPHALVQDYLNRSESLWGIATNGIKWRLLRDSARIARPTYAEFDLQTIVESNLYSEFVLLWRLLHRTRFPRGETSAHECLLEQYHQQGIDEGGRVRDHLRDGVARAIEILGRALFQHPGSVALRKALREGGLSALAYYQELLRLIYRMLFLMVAEERRLLFDGERGNELHGIYSEHYSLTRLRVRADRPLGRDSHTDLWRGLLVTFGLFRDEDSARVLGLTPLDGDLFHESACPHLSDALCTNEDLLQAVRELSTFEEQQGRRRTGMRRRVNYGGLDVEELGSVYESLLEMQPRLSVDDPPDFILGQSGERKTTGSYYTPPPLVAELIKSALEPVIEDRLKLCKSAEEKEKALLHIKVCDPAAGSGHFLLAAARRLGKELARARTDSEEPDPVSYRHAVRDVVAHCIYGVDLNPMAVELCKVALWLESMEPGRPLSFLSHRIKRGNSLIGATPALLQKGIPDDAFKPIEGDEKEVCGEYRKRNKRERFPQGRLFTDEGEPWARLGDVAGMAAALDAQSDDSVQGYRAKQERYEKLVSSGSYLYSRLWADAWCAAFVIVKRKDRLQLRLTEQDFRLIEQNPAAFRSNHSPLYEEIRRLARQYGFFHWHLEFPDVFRLPSKEEKPENEITGLCGGFDCVLGNPPWERIKLQEKEFFASRNPEIAGAPNAAARRRMIARLPETDPVLHQVFKDALRHAEGESRLVRDTGRYPLCGRGDVNTYSIFAELKRSLLNPAGRVGCIVPSGIATDDTTKFFFQDLTETQSLVSLYDFENRKGIFPAIDSRMKFCLLTLTGSARPHKQAEFVFFAHEVEDLADPNRRFTLSAEDIKLLNPNTRTCPIFRSKRDAELTKYIYRRVPVLVREARGGRPEENPWGVKFLRMFDMSNDSGLFRTREQLEADGWELRGNIFERNGERYLPLYEAKLFHQFDHRFATYDGNGRGGAATRDVTDAEKASADTVVLPRYWVSAENVAKKLDNGEMSAAAAVDRQTDRPRSAESRNSWLAAGVQAHHQRDERAHRDIRTNSPVGSGRLNVSDAASGNWMLAFRDISNATNERTGIFAVIPSLAVGNKAPVILPLRRQE